MFKNFIKKTLKKTRKDGAAGYIEILIIATVGVPILFGLFVLAMFMINNGKLDSLSSEMAEAINQQTRGSQYLLNEMDPMEYDLLIDILVDQTQKSVKSSQIRLTIDGEKRVLTKEEVKDLFIIEDQSLCDQKRAAEEPYICLTTRVEYGDEYTRELVSVDIGAKFYVLGRNGFQDMLSFLPTYTTGYTEITKEIGRGNPFYN